MKGASRFSFRTTVFLLIVLITVVNLATVGSAIMLFRAPAAAEEGRQSASQTAAAVSARVEYLLGSVQDRLLFFGAVAPQLSPAALTDMMRRFVGDGETVRALYLLDGAGRVAFASSPVSPARLRDLVGADFSYSPLYQSAENSRGPVWSDKFISSLSGDTAVGVAFRGDSTTLLAELPLSLLLDTVRIAASSASAVWVVDRRGEVVADTEGRYRPGEANVLGLPFIREALSGDFAPATVRLDGKAFHAAATRSDILGWAFVAREPAYGADPRILATLAEVLLLAGGAVVFGLLLGSLWAMRIGGGMGSLMAFASAVSERRALPALKPSIVAEFGVLAEELRELGKKVEERESALRRLNEELEDRVRARTAELAAANDELLRAQKLAALGKLVAGIAHELNTPLGNGVMAVSTLSDRLGQFEREASSGLRKSALAAYLEDSRSGLDIALRNLRRAAGLIGDFKQLAVDRTSDQRREFFLDEVVRENLLALHPVLKRMPFAVVTDIPEGIRMDGYPGLLGQILSNLVNNAVVHGFAGRDSGTVTVRARRDGDRMRLEVADDGIGIPEPNRQHIFEPFFTTRRGSGGSGLGLNLAHNAATTVLGGTLGFESAVGEGTRFILDLPLTAPQRPAVEH